MFQVYLTKDAQKDAKKIKQAGLQNKTLHLLEILKNNPFETHPPYEKLIGNLEGFYSRRINIQHRLVYEIDDHLKVIKVIRLWSHYESL